MTREQAIQYFMALGNDKASATKMADNYLASQASAAAADSLTLWTAPQPQTKTVWTGPGQSYPSKVVTGTVDKPVKVSTDKAVAMYYANDADSKKIKDRLRSALTARGYTNITDEQMGSTWEALVKRAAQQSAAGFNQTPWDLIPLTVPQNTAAATQTTQSYVTNYFTSKGAPNAAANALLKSTLTDVLGRVPSAEDINSYKSIFTDMYAKQKAGLFTSKYNSKTGVTTPAIDPKAWLQEQVANKHQASIQYGKENAKQSTLNQFTELAMDYGYNPYAADGKTLSAASKLTLSKIEAGKMTIEDATEAFKQAALAKYSYLKPQFDAGLSLRQVAAPGLSAIGSLLERDTNAISLDDPLVQKYLYGVDGKSVMPIYKYEAMLKQQNEWQFTKNARSTFSDLASFIGQKFGRNA